MRSVEVMRIGPESMGLATENVSLQNLALFRNNVESAHHALSCHHDTALLAHAWSFHATIAPAPRLPTS